MTNMPIMSANESKKPFVNKNKICFIYFIIAKFID